MTSRAVRSVFMLCALLVVCGEAAAQNTASSDADLSGLTLSAGTLDPAFARDSLAYTATVANSTTSLTVTPTSNHSGAAITVNGTSVSSGSASSGISLSVGENTITVVVTAEDNTTTKTYTVTVARGVNIPSAGLRGAIERALQKSSGAIITPSEMATLTTLNASDSFIYDLTGLEHATSMRDLGLALNGISDLSPIQGLTSLIRLNLANNHLTSVALSGLPNLQYLYLDMNSIRELSLSGLSSLTSLSLDANFISDISSLQGLTSLIVLDLPDNRISDISALSGLTNLLSLRLSRNSISDLSPLRGLTKLISLYLLYNSVSDLSPLQGLTSLRELYLNDNLLNYPSLTTHIPALQSQGVSVTYDGRTVTSLVKISGDDQTGTAGTRLSAPLIVEVRDENDAAFAGVPVAFSVAAGSGVLSATTDTTDADGQSSTRLTLGTAGVNTVVAAIAVSNIDKSVTFTATATGGTTISSDADLSGLTLSAGTLDPAFASDSLAYTATVANSTTSLTVTPTSNHSGAAITVNGTSVSSGSASSGISLSVGENAITIVVTAEDNTTTKTYTVTVARGVNIPSAGLRAAIERALQKSSGAIITPSDMATLTRFYLLQKEISDLTGLEHATSLTSLDLAGNRISDISSLQGLTSLTVLDISDNRISDISALSGLTSLISLSLSRNSISDLSPLRGLTSLISLRLLYTSVSDLSPLKGLSSLESLSLSNTSVSDLSPLQGLSLRDLGLSHTSVSDLSPLQGLTSLGSLGLVNTNVSDISPLSGLTNLGNLYLRDNLLNYPSLTTHIPALQSQGVYVSYDGRTLTSLVKISGDDQTGTAGTRLSDPLIVEVRDENDVAFAGVPVAFSVTAGGGSLSATTAATDANGRASTMLTLGAAGVDTVVAAIDVSNIDKSVNFLATATGGTTVAGATISSTVPASLTEANLNGATVNITLTGTTYNETLAANHFALHTAPQGASISGTPVRTSATVAQLTLAYAGLGFDASQNLRVTVKAAAHSGSEDLTTGAVTVTATQGPVTVVTELGQVTGVAVSPGVGYLAVSWTAVTGATGYKVQWKSGDEVYASARQQAIDNGGKTSSTIAGLTAGTEYTVRVIATKTNADDGQPSVDVTGTPTAAGTQPPPPTSSDDADLSGLTLSAGTLAPAFARDSLAYTATVSNSTTSLTVTPTSNHSGAAITVNGTSVSSGSASSGISLSVGENTITIVVTSEDNTTTKTYTVTVTVTLGVHIPDAGLRAVIEGALQKSSGAIITSSEMATLTTLPAWDRNIYDLTGLEHATNLRDLGLALNGISDISPIQGLTSLIRLNLTNNHLTSVSLSGLPNLQYLYLDMNSIRELSLSGLSSLTSLSLDGNFISDISSLQGLTNLTVLDLPDNRISDISALSGLTNLLSLRLSRNSISDLSPLRGLTKLISLYLLYNSVSDLSPLQGLTSLRELYLGYTSVSDISPLQGLNLTTLALSHTSVSDISPLQGLTSLGSLGLANTNVSDISLLSGLTNLGNLYLHDNLLNYPSLTTHIPALQSHGVSVEYDGRTVTSLVKISGDDQTGTAGTRLSAPLIVEVRDENDAAFAGVPVAFSVAAGSGVLSTATDTTDANGRASTRLTLGTAGVNTVVAAIDVSSIDKSVTFTATATGAMAEMATISSTVPASLTEENLDGATVNITLTGTTYNEALAANHFALHTAPQGASISGTPVRTSATVAQLTLAYAGLGFDASQNLRVTVKAAAHSGSEDLTTGSVTVTPAQGTGPVTVVTELGQVTGVEVWPGESSLAVSWTAVTGATGYKVQWKSGDEVYASDRQRVIDNGGTTSATIAGLTAGTQYTVRVIATLTNADDGQPSVGVTGTPAEFIGLILSAGRIISITLPPVTGGDEALTYTLTPDLPSGLTFDAETRAISGTPREVMDETEYTLTATNAEGDVAALTFTISVTADRLPSFDASTRIAAQSYTIGDSVRVTLPEATGGDGTLVYILWPSLSNGLRFDSATRTISGRPSRLLAETEYTLSAVDADGDIASLTFTLEVQQPTANADFDGNGRVDIADFWFFTFHYGMRRGDAGYDARYDLNSDGEIGFSDYLIFAEHFGTGG